PGPLTEEERKVMCQHPVYAHEWLWPIQFLRPALAIPYSHHERWDGSGYPEALTGESIPLAARIFAFADVWDALRSDRPYRSALSEDDAIHYIKEQVGRQFDPALAPVFFQYIAAKA